MQSMYFRRTVGLLPLTPDPDGIGASVVFGSRVQTKPSEAGFTPHSSPQDGLSTLQRRFKSQLSISMHAYAGIFNNEPAFTFISLFS